MNRRQMLNFATVSAIGLGGGLGVVRSASATPVSDMLRELNQVLSTLQRANARLDGVRSDFTPPDPADVPPIQAALNSIIAEANHTIAVAQELQGLV